MSIFRGNQRHLTQSLDYDKEVSSRIIIGLSSGGNIRLGLLDGDLPATLYIVVSAVVVVLILFSFYVCRYVRIATSAKDGRSKLRYADTVKKAREDVLNKKDQWEKPASDDVDNLPQNGYYTAKYFEQGEERIVRLQLKFIDNGENYKLEGGGEDIAGKTALEEGFVNYDGLAYWKEAYSNTTFSCLTQGKFNFKTNSFRGTWTASNGLSGKYVSFTAE